MEHGCWTLQTDTQQQATVNQNSTNLKSKICSVPLLYLTLNPLEFLTHRNSISKSQTASHQVSDALDAEFRSHAGSSLVGLELDVEEQTA